jgi:hypothetical protein
MALIPYLSILIERGYFPSQLPPCFTTSSLAVRATKVLADYGNLKEKDDSTRGEHFSVARIGHSRRLITIPNPIAQLNVAKIISDNWVEIEAHFKNSEISQSLPLIQISGDRATAIASLSELYERRLIASAGYKWILRTDISRFFPTLYTHIIPWALHTKNVAKNNKKDLGLLGNKIDQALRLCQDGQTIGIPIGPDTSHIIAELVAVSIDRSIYDKCGKWPVGYRHVDDFFFCFNERAEAEQALSIIEKALHEFELDINATKTSIVDTSSLQEDDWVHAIRAFHIENSGAERQRDSLHRYFSLVAELSRRHSDENVVKFALKRIVGTVFHPEVWPLFEAYLLRFGQMYHNCIQGITHIIATYAYNGYKTNASAIANFCATVISERASSEHHSEVTWALWMACELQVKLSARAVKAVQEMRSSICALLLLSLAKEDLLEVGIDKAFWEGLFDEGAMRGPLWLLAYEGVRAGWLTPSCTNEIKGSKIYAALNKNNIIFFDHAKRLAPLFHPKDPVALKSVLQPGAGGVGLVFQHDFFNIEWIFDDIVDDYID